MGAEVFSFPKDETIIAKFVEMAVESTATENIVVDFFAGSGTTAHAVIAQNAADGGKRKYILVQLPEPLDPENKEQENPARFCDKLKRPRNIAELTKERLRRAAKAVRKELPKLDRGIDFGFRVFKLDSSNIQAWEPKRENLDQNLLDSVEHIKGDRSENDVLYELLLKLGLDLCVPIEQKKIAGKVVHSIGAGALIACLATKVASTDIEPLAHGIVAWHKALAPAGETTIVFRDSAFEGDVAKTNITAILHQHGLETIRSL